MNESVRELIEQVIEHEGGFVYAEPPQIDQPTYAGVTQIFIDDMWDERDFDGMLPPQVRDLTPDLVMYLYGKLWDRLGLDPLPSPVAYMIFDAAVNVGSGWASVTLQKLAGVKQDGIIGPRTVEAVMKLPTLPTMEAFTRERILRAIDRTDAKYIKGIINRIIAVHTLSITMITYTRVVGEIRANPLLAVGLTGGHPVEVEDGGWMAGPRGPK